MVTSSCAYPIQQREYERYQISDFTTVANASGKIRGTGPTSLTTTIAGMSRDIRRRLYKHETIHQAGAITYSKVTVTTRN
jgi:hypothetical protein